MRRESAAVVDDFFGMNKHGMFYSHSQHYGNVAAAGSTGRFHGNHHQRGCQQQPMYSPPVMTSSPVARDSRSCSVEFNVNVNLKVFSKSDRTTEMPAAMNSQYSGSAGSYATSEDVDSMAAYGSPRRDSASIVEEILEEGNPGRRVSNYKGGMLVCSNYNRRSSGPHAQRLPQGPDTLGLSWEDGLEALEAMLGTEGTPYPDTVAKNMGWGPQGLNPSLGRDTPDCRAGVQHRRPVHQHQQQQPDCNVKVEPDSVKPACQYIRQSPQSNETGSNQYHQQQQQQQPQCNRPPTNAGPNTSVPRYRPIAIKAENCSPKSSGPPASSSSAPNYSTSGGFLVSATSFSGVEVYNNPSVPVPVSGGNQSGYGNRVPIPPATPVSQPSSPEGGVVPRSSPPPTYLSGSTPMNTVPVAIPITPVTGRVRATHPGCTTIKYNRKNNPELEKRRIHFCDFPGEYFLHNFILYKVGRKVKLGSNNQIETRVRFCMYKQ